MSEIDHTNSLAPDQAQQNVWLEPNEKGPYDLRKGFGQKKNVRLTQHAKKKTLLYLEHDDTCWAYDVTNDHFLQSTTSRSYKVILFLP